MESSTAAASQTSTDQLRRLYGFMAQRWFVAGRVELVDAGFGSTQIDSWLRRGRMLKVLRGVYSYGRDVESPQALWRAALVASGSGSVLTARSACEAWGIVKPRMHLPRRVETAVPAGNARVLRGLSPALRETRVKVVKRQFGLGDVRHRHDLDVVDPIFALMEFAVEASAREVRFAFLEACRLKYVRRRDVGRCYERLGGRRGARKIKPLLALWVPELERIRSVLEGLFLLAWVELGLPMPEVNVKVCGYEVDFYWPAHGVVLELDGDAFHDHPPQRAIDAAKQRDLEAQGLRVLRATYRQFDQGPERVLGQAAGALGISL